MNTRNVVIGVVGGAAVIGLVAFLFKGNKPVEYAQPAAQQSYQEAAPVPVVAPLPRFNTLQDCIQAYGAGACGSGQTVYVNNGHPAPHGSGDWFIPFAFGAMTGALLNSHFSAPQPFTPGYNYSGYTSPQAASAYKTVNQTTINNYASAPASVKQQAAANPTAPVTYKPPVVNPGNAGAGSRPANVSSGALQNAQPSTQPGAAAPGVGARPNAPSPGALQNASPPPPRPPAPTVAPSAPAPQTAPAAPAYRPPPQTAPAAPAYRPPPAPSPSYHPPAPAPRTGGPR